MEILIIISISILGWIFIELLSKTKQKLPYGFTKDMVNKEYVDDANSLLKNSILYIILFIICYFINKHIVSYVVGGILSLFAIIPAISSLTMPLKGFGWKLSIAAMISEIIPLFISALGLYTNIRSDENKGIVLQIAGMLAFILTLLFNR